MNKRLLLVFILITSISMLLTFSLSSCKEEAAETTAAGTTAAETTAAETTAAETTAAETTVAEDMNEIDPFITEIREPWEALKTTIDVSWKGPDGETPQLDNTIWLTRAEVEKLRAGKPDGTPYTYAVVANNTAGEYSLSMNSGPNSGLWSFMEYCGVKQVAFTSAEFDPIKQKSDVETVVALKPDVICAYATDPVTGAENFKPAVDAGIPIAFISTVPQGYTYGKEFIGIATNNPWEEGIYCAQAMNDLLGDEAKVGYVFYDDVYFVCNYLDQGFKTYADKNYPNWTIYEQGFVAETQAGEAAAAILQRNPEVQGFYTTYMVPAMHIVAALTDADRLEDVVVVTFGIDEPTLINVIENGPVKALCTDSPYLVGMNHAIQACYALLDKPLEQPSFVVCPTAMIVRENVREIWDVAMHLPMSDTLKEVIDKAGL
jgi:ribose transport system substrate-binding protein